MLDLNIVQTKVLMNLIEDNYIALAQREDITIDHMVELSLVYRKLQDEFERSFETEEVKPKEKPAAAVRLPRHQENF